MVGGSKMEEKQYLNILGKRVKEIRKKMHMSQIEFHSFLFPEDGRNSETIKKRMNAIENNKYQSLDLEFLLTLCHKCDVSCDYVLGVSEDYTNHEIEFVSNYTGLNEEAIQILHKWNIDKNNGADISKMDGVFIGGDAEEQYKKAKNKQEGIQFLRIINYLFTEGVRKNLERRGRKEKYSNLTILYALYMLCMSKPEVMQANLSNESLGIGNGGLFDPHIMDVSEYQIKVDARKPFILQDSSKIMHYCSAQQIIDQYARNMLNKSVDRLIEQIRKEEHDCLTPSE